MCFHPTVLKRSLKRDLNMGFHVSHAVSTRVLKNLQSSSSTCRKRQDNNVHGQTHKHVCILITHAADQVILYKWKIMCTYEVQNLK